MADNHNRAAVVTGGAGGIGMGCCEALTDDGFKIVVADLNEEKAKEGAAKLGGDAIAIQHDVTDPESSANLVAQVTERFGRIDVLVNNAGFQTSPTPVEHTTEEQFDNVMTVNVKGLFLTTRAVVPVMKKQGAGRIINMASVVGLQGVPFILPYCASKWAVMGITKLRAAELAPDINVNVVCPGIVDTELHGQAVTGISQMQGQSEEETWEWFRQGTPLKRFQSARDMGDMVAYLASAKANNITGGTFSVDGGSSIA